MKEYLIRTEEIGLSTIGNIIDNQQKIVLSDDVKKRIKQCRSYLDDKIASSDQPIYGINTGFGSLYDKDINKNDLEKLQVNLVLPHACVTGDTLPSKIVQLMLLLKIQSLSYGHSGVQLSTVERLVDFYNQNVFPVVYEFGSLGASGDLAPLAHLSLPLIGLGEVDYKGMRLSGGELNNRLGWNSLCLKSKEGLALLNGTQFMGAFGIWSVLHAKRISQLATLIGSLSLDVFDGRIEAFDALAHKIRPQKGQQEVARDVRAYLEGSEIISGEKIHVQDPYSFRCIPQVHGASLDAIRYAENVFSIEINSVTDNPSIFPEDDLIISAGNFHGQPLAITLDFLSIALSELGNISERRTYQLISGSRGLPNYLVANPGINSGLMIPQYTAASLVSKNKELCHPASSDSIVSSNGQEDHVSMGANAATKVYKIVNNVYSILAIELINASQALEFRRPAKTSEKLEQFVNEFRYRVPFIEEDRVLHNDIAAAEEFVKTVEV